MSAHKCLNMLYLLDFMSVLENSARFYKRKDSVYFIHSKCIQ